MKIMAVLSAFFILFCCSCNRLAKDKNIHYIDPDDPSLVYEIHCALLIQDFKDDETYAKQKYDGKEYLISGIVDQKGKGSLTDNNKEYLFDGRSYITVCDSTKPVVDFIICLFNDDMSDDLAKLNIGDSVYIQGMINANSERIMVENCKVVDDATFKTQFKIETQFKK